jgi:hypothetical protein
VEFSIDAGLFDLFIVKHYLEYLLGCAVDLGTTPFLLKDYRLYSSSSLAFFASKTLARFASLRRFLK